MAPSGWKVALEERSSVMSELMQQQLLQLYGVIGYPLGHSMSPLVHNTAFRTLGIPGVFFSWPIEPARLPAFVEAVRTLGIRGCSVTIPHKIALLPLLDDMTDRVRIMGAANTIFWRDGLLCGENTDVLGFIRPLKTLGLSSDMRVLLLGAGGAARAAAVGLQSLGLKDIVVTSPTLAHAESLASRFGMRAVPWERRKQRAELIVNTTPLGMHGIHQQETPYPEEAFGDSGIAYDIVYTPVRTRFLQEAERAGWHTVGGLEMFIGQGDAQFYLWTGQHLPGEAREAVLKALSSGPTGGQNGTT